MFLKGKRDPFIHVQELTNVALSLPLGKVCKVNKRRCEVAAVVRRGGGV